MFFSHLKHAFHCEGVFVIEPSFASLIGGGGGLNLSQFVFSIIHIFKAEFNKHQDSDINTINMSFCLHPFGLRNWAANAREERTVGGIKNNFTPTF